MDTDPQTRAAIAAFRRGVERLYGDRLEAVLLFGSRARGDFREDSDVDLAVVLSGPLDNPYNEIGRIVDETYVPTMEAGRVVQAFVVSNAEFRGGDLPIFQEIRAEGVPV